MPFTDDSIAQQKPAAKSPSFAKASEGKRPERVVVLPVAQLYAIKGAERHGMELILTAILGDERTPPKRHGLRAPLPLWVEFVTALAAEDPTLRESLEAALKALPRA